MCFISHCIIVELSPTPQSCLCLYSYLNDSIVCELKIVYFFLAKLKGWKRSHVSKHELPAITKACSHLYEFILHK